MYTSSLVSTAFTYLSYWLCHYSKYIDAVVDTNDDTSMDEIYVAFVEDEHVDNHDYDDSTDDDYDSKNDIYDDILNNLFMIYR